ncbi:hypothetical protein M0R04_15545 [Candidatus Dojkabacteria bacterium]|jgi:hypothetical protein|nr:hypothetical protein [Candidatus Dojkabacteria bacterium]
MNDNNKAEEQVVETETTQVESPTTEAPITGEQTEIKESDDQGSVVEESDDVPEGNEETRRAFQEMRQELKQLKEEKQNRTKGESAFSAFRQQTPPAGDAQTVNIMDFQDPLTGETNWQAYNQQVNNALGQVRQSATYEAKEAIKEELDEQKARDRFPELFANSDDEQEIADKWLAAKVRGENPSIFDIAERYSKRVGKAVSKAEKIGAEKILNEVNEKETASLTVSGQTSQPAKQAASAEQLAELSRKSRFGDDDAIAARMSNIPWANK